MAATPNLTQISAAVWDNLRKRLYVAATDPDTGSDIVAEFNPYTATFSTLLSGFSSLRWGSLSIHSDFSELYVADNGAGELRTYTLPRIQHGSTCPWRQHRLVVSPQPRLWHSVLIPI